jgi:hypothetical protein
MHLCPFDGKGLNVRSPHKGAKVFGHSDFEVEKGGAAGGSLGKNNMLSSLTIIVGQKDALSRNKSPNVDKAFPEKGFHVQTAADSKRCLSEKFLLIDFHLSLCLLS